MILETMDDIFDLIDKFESGGLCELELSIPRQIKIKMAKGARDNPQAAAKTEIKTERAEENPGKTITAPLVGTFYSAPSPDSEPYVTIGSKVSKGMTVCVIEAMKTMNEIDSGDTYGEIAEILAENGGPVEYGQVLFRLK